MKSSFAKLKKNIQDVFPLFPQPDKDQLIRPCSYPRYQKSADEIRHALTGKSWQEIDKKFLDNYFFYMRSYLAFPAYAYYLPAFLSECLDNFFKENRFISTVIYSGLSPGYTSLYYEGKDGFIDGLIPYLTDRQYDAICQFLELAFDLSPNVAPAIRWGWNKKDNSVRRKALAYYEQFYNYEYPSHQDQNVQKLIDQIQEAFSTTPMPSENSLISSRQSDEEGEYALTFRGLKWQLINPRLTEVCYAALGFFTPEAFRYYLPSYIFSDLYGYNSAADPVFHLTHGFYKDDKMAARESQARNPINWEEYARKRYALFSPGERQAIIAYLNYRKQLNEFDKSDIEQALANYWTKSLDIPG